ncbi:MAG TPA: hypothetical protein VNH18_07400 [Bryobacteraceae bacterium]|nr:hypothetical protein [Bryobacteraceae bacterium]
MNLSNDQLVDMLADYLDAGCGRAVFQIEREMQAIADQLAVTTDRPLVLAAAQ